MSQKSFDAERLPKHKKVIKSQCPSASKKIYLLSQPPNWYSFFKRLSILTYRSFRLWMC